MKNGNNISEKDYEKYFEEERVATVKKENDGKKESLIEYSSNLRTLRDRFKKGGAAAKTNLKFALIAILVGVVIIGGLLLYSQMRFPF